MVSDEPIANNLQAQTERLRALLLDLQADSGCAIPPLLTATLFDFSIATVEQHRLEHAGEIARSLASLLHHCGLRVPDEQERLQVTVLVERLLQALVPKPIPSAAILTDAYRPLVTPIAPSSATSSLRILLHIDGAGERLLLDEALAAAGFEVRNIASLEALAALDERTRPAAIIADLSLCRRDAQAGERFADLRRWLSPPPHLFCIGAAEDIPARLDAVRLGATRFLATPIDTARLVAVLRGVTAQTPRRPYRVLMVDDDPLLGQLYADVLNEAGIETFVLDDPLAVPQAIAGFDPDVIVSDIFMPGCNGFELLALLRQDDALADTPIVLLSSEGEIGRRMEALDLGADDYLSKPVSGDVMVATVVARAKRARMLKRSRSEYRRVLQHVREIERAQQQSGSPLPGDHWLEETINLDDYVVGEIHRDSDDKPR